MSGVSTATLLTVGVAGLGAATSIAGGIQASQGAQQQASATAEAGRFNALAYENAALAADRNKHIARDKATLEAKDQRVKNRAVQGQIRAAYGASGLAIDGSPLDVLEATAVEQELDVDKILYRGDIEALGEDDRALSFRTQAMLARMGASNAQTAGSYASATALLSGVSGALKAGAGAIGGFAGSGGYPGSGTTV